MDSTNKVFNREDPDKLDNLKLLVNRSLKGRADQRQVLSQVFNRLEAIKQTMTWLRSERERLIGDVNEKNKHGG
tara:strand:- start:123 stop:344 length:222 start_codon:yes stop_codon:yes gene_type:complete